MGLFQKNLDIKARPLDRPTDFSQLFPCSVRYLFLDGIEGGVESRWTNFPSRRCRPVFPAVGVGEKGEKSERKE